MGKSKIIYFCQSCGAEAAKWIGQCPSCSEWNTYVEEVVSKNTTNTTDFVSKKKPPVNLIEVLESEKNERLLTHIQELDRVLGGGIVDGALVLVGGEPGIGKSTLMLQMVMKLTKKSFYVSGEESVEQIKMRAERIGLTHQNCFLYAETNLADVLREAENLRPNVLIIDSIQTLHSDKIESAIGSISQVKECASQLMKFAKQRQISIFLIGHVNKEGGIAGPKVLEHIVDTVLQFEGDRHMSYRILRTTKNRFGPTSELGIFEMNASGLREVNNPSEVLISPHDPDLSGISLGATIEGNRPLILETQVLVSPTSFGNPQRSATGYDYKRLTMLLAVMEKRLGIRLSTQDVFLNIAGGIKIQDTALDLAICTAIFSSFEDVSLKEKICFTGEIGLGGEIRPINRLENRINEAEKLGFNEIYISKYNLKAKDIGRFKIKIHSFTKLSDVLRHLF